MMIRKFFNNRISIRVLQIFLLVVIILAGAYFRLVGINWDQDFHLHPDERFLTMVEASIRPVNSIGEYFDTEHSTLNPHNMGYSFFVYGTFPLFLVRYLAQWLGQVDYGQVYMVGRYASGFFDLLTILFIYLIAIKLYKNKWLGLIAAALASFSVLPIQQSHFFTVDYFANFFTVLAIYFAVCILTFVSDSDEKFIEKNDNPPKIFMDWNGIANYIFFGMALGLAVASKVNTVVVAGLLPVAVFLNSPRVFVHRKDGKWQLILRNLVVAAIVSLIVFRIAQPYAFSGPGILNISPNPKWLDNLKELNFLSSGDSNYPPSLQWARRPVWFGMDNMALWGMGLPLGIVACLSFIWMGVKIIRGEWQSHSLIWLWSGLYFLWQSLRWNPTMRYFLPVYPTLTIIAAWGLIQLWQKVNQLSSTVKWSRLLKTLSVVVIALTITATALWAFAFTRIYTEPVTRVAASEWIYQNIEGAINLNGENNGLSFHIPLAYPHFYSLTAGDPLVIKFVPEKSGKLSKIGFDHIADTTRDSSVKNVNVNISEDSPNGNIIASGQLTDSFISSDDSRGNAYVVELTQAINLDPKKVYFIQIVTDLEQKPLELAGNIFLNITTSEGEFNQPIFKSAPILKSGAPFTIPFIPSSDGSIQKIQLFRVLDINASSEMKTLKISIVALDQDRAALASAEISNSFIRQDDFRGSLYEISLPTPLQIQAGVPYALQLELGNNGSSLVFYGSQQANESSWDDAIPLSMHGNNPFDYESGVFQSDLNFEMYWDDNAQKLQRFETILDQADYIYITSNRQWGSITQIPERYPLSTTYYRDLLGCPQDKDIQWCYRVAQPGVFKGKLGFDLIQVFQSDPTVAGLKINDQFSEEAFTVYDHPKVLIFKKTNEFSPDKVNTLLSAVDLSKINNLSPAQANKTPGILTLTPEQEQVQTNGGTWLDLFNPSSWVNKYPLIGLVVWYLVLTLLGWIVYPTVRIALGGLRDRGYPILKLAGLLFLALPVWLAGSAGIPFNKLTMTVAGLGLVIFNFLLFNSRKSEIIDEIKANAKYYLWVEVISLCFFIFFLLIRLGNPDLWHAYKGGEKPMDFSYFTAVLKSTIFPPYDPWYAGGYINYYYYGFVIAGVPVKWLGIIPSVAYNLILPTFFSFAAMGAFCAGWNLINVDLDQKKNILSAKLNKWKHDLLLIIQNPFVVGLICAFLFLVLGNLGTVRMIFQGFQTLASAGVPIETADIFHKIIWTIEGIVKFIGGQRFNYYPGDWYWIPSRTIPGEAITEFPFFTFLYADPHAHLFALAITILALLWGLSLLLTNKKVFEKTSLFSKLIIIIFGSIIVGSLWPTNSWDFPIYLGINSIILVYITLRENFAFKGIFEFLPKLWRKIITALVVLVIFIGLSFLIYSPFRQWFGQAYNSVDFWTGEHTPLNSYLTHWGVFLFITITWLIWEFRNWMAKTPLSSLRKLLPYKNFIIGGLVVVIFLFIVLLFAGIQVACVALPIILIAFLLLIRKDQTEIKRFVLLLTIVGFSLTLAVEVIVLHGDIGRMNTVFKFYLQAWTLLSISSACYLVWITRSVILEWSTNWQKFWFISVSLILLGALLFTITATIDKVTDRISHEVPITLNGMDFMNYSQYQQNNTLMNLEQDYQAILWMQQNVQGSPVIVEGNVPEYQWGNRFTIYTGLPGVVGWNWHERQQRAILPQEWVTQRIDEIQQFYTTSDIVSTKQFLIKYHVKYIIVGQLERIVYPGGGLLKFNLQNGILWDQVYQNSDTQIFKVRDNL